MKTLIILISFLWLIAQSVAAQGIAVRSNNGQATNLTAHGNTEFVGPATFDSTVQAAGATMQVATIIADSVVGPHYGDGAGMSNTVAAAVSGTITNDTTGNAATATSATSSVNSSNLFGQHYPTVKASFSTNYTAVATDAVLFCTGTNQVITLPDAASVNTGKMLTVIAATTTGDCVLTNYNGSQTIQGALSVTNASKAKVTVISNGVNWW